jgi:hypothetical protein
MTDSNSSTQPAATVTATLQRPAQLGGRHILHVVFTSTARTAPTSVAIELLKELMPEDADVRIAQEQAPAGPNLRRLLLGDSWQSKWTCEYSTPGEARIALSLEGTGTPAPRSEKDPPWELRFLVDVIRPEGALAAKIELDAEAGGLALPAKVLVGEAPTTPVTPVIKATLETKTTLVTTTTPAAPVVELWAAGPDVSALRFGEAFTLWWRVSGVYDAELWGPLSPTERRRVLVKGDGTVKGPKSNSIDLVAVGPMYFTLRAMVPGQNLPVVRALTVGMLRDPRGGRVDVWPQQVLPRGPVACHWSTFEVTRFAFRAITGDVVDELIDAPSITDIGHTYAPSDPLARTFKQESFTVDYGPRAGREWTVSAESEPRGDARALQSRVGAIGVRKLLSSLPTASFGPPLESYGPGDWPYLAVALEKRGDSKALTAPPEPADTTCADSQSSHAISMAAGRFHVSRPAAQSAPAASMVRREWIAIAKSDRVELHVNKLKGERSYKVDPRNHLHVDGLMDFLARAALGVGAAEHVIETPGASDLHRGEVVVMVRREGTDKLVVAELSLPLDKKSRARDVEIRSSGGTDSSERLRKAAKVRIVALWPRVYLFGDDSVVYSYDRRGLQSEAVRAEVEEALFKFASPHWEVVAVPGEATYEERGTGDKTQRLRRHPLGGYLFALHRVDGKLRRITVDAAGKVTSIRELDSANGPVAKLHDLQLQQADGQHRIKSADGNILLRKHADGRRDVVPPINEASSLLRIGGALVARSEVHDPSVRPIAATIDGKVVRRGLQDRAYNPRLGRWVRCGHPFHEARGHAKIGEGALFASTSDTLYCRTAGTGEITYISPIEPSHLGFLRMDLTPDPNLGEELRAAPAADRLFAGQSLERGEHLESPQGLFRLTYTAGGNLVLHRTAVPQSMLDQPDTLDDRKKALFCVKGVDKRGRRATLEPDGDLVFRDKDGDPFFIGSVAQHPLTGGTPLRLEPKEKRLQTFRRVRLTLGDDGVLLCTAEVGEGAEVVVWGAPGRSRGTTLSSGRDSGDRPRLVRWDYLESPDGAYRFGAPDGIPRIVKVATGAATWTASNATEVDSIYLDEDRGWLCCARGLNFTVWVSAAFGGDTRERPKAAVQLVLGNDGVLVLRDGDAEVWRSDKCRGERLNEGETLRPGEYLESAGREHRLVFERQGRLVLYKMSSGPRWSTPHEIEAMKPQGFTLSADGVLRADVTLKEKEPVRVLTLLPSWLEREVRYREQARARARLFPGCSLKVDARGLALCLRDGAELSTLKENATGVYAGATNPAFERFQAAHLSTDADGRILLGALWAGNEVRGAWGGPLRPM